MACLTPRFRTQLIAIVTLSWLTHVAAEVAFPAQCAVPTSGSGVMGLGTRAFVADADGLNLAGGGAGDITNVAGYVSADDHASLLSIDGVVLTQDASCSCRKRL